MGVGSISLCCEFGFLLATSSVCAMCPEYVHHDPSHHLRLSLFLCFLALCATHFSVGNCGIIVSRLSQASPHRGREKQGQLIRHQDLAML
jgi:hypothetical protein